MFNEINVDVLNTYSIFHITVCTDTLIWAVVACRSELCTLLSNVQVNMDLSVCLYTPSDQTLFFHY